MSERGRPRGLAEAADKLSAGLIADVSGSRSLVLFDNALLMNTWLVYILHGSDAVTEMYFGARPQNKGSLARGCLRKDRKEFL